MKLLYLSSSLLVLITLVSCSKFREDRITGTWKLTSAYYQGLFDRDYYQTGYEDGVFIFNRDGSAQYLDAADTLNGFWNMDYYTVSNGDDSHSYYALEIQLINFTANRAIYFSFDNFNFQNNYRRIRARDFRSGRDRIIEFSKQ